MNKYLIYLIVFIANSVYAQDFAFIDQSSSNGIESNSLILNNMLYTCTYASNNPGFNFNIIDPFSGVRKTINYTYESNNIVPYCLYLNADSSFCIAGEIDALDTEGDAFLLHIDKCGNIVNFVIFSEPVGTNYAEFAGVMESNYYISIYALWPNWSTLIRLDPPGNIKNTNTFNFDFGGFKMGSRKIECAGDCYFMSNKSGGGEYQKAVYYQFDDSLHLKSNWKYNVNDTTHFYNITDFVSIHGFNKYLILDRSSVSKPKIQSLAYNSKNSNFEVITDTLQYEIAEQFVAYSDSLYIVVGEQFKDISNLFISNGFVQIIENGRIVKRKSILDTLGINYIVSEEMVALGDSFVVICGQGRTGSDGFTFLIKLNRFNLEIAKVTKSNLAFRDCFNFSNVSIELSSPQIISLDVKDFKPTATNQYMPRIKNSGGYIFPNPAATYINTRNIKNVYKIIIFNSNGKIEFECANIDNNTIKISSLAPGLYYFIAYDTFGNKLYSEKLVIQN